MLKMKYDAQQPLFVAAEPFQPPLYKKEFQMPLLLISPKVVTPVSTHIFNSSLHVVKELKENIGSLHKLIDITWLVFRPFYFLILKQKHLVTTQNNAPVLQNAVQTKLKDRICFFPPGSSLAHSPKRTEDSC